uniref:Uncharacterized protein n=1 Tax=Rhizophora mucronata TaxID=61149 RepID=A0A2P2Q4A2_RHIMU
MDMNRKVYQIDIFYCEFYFIFLTYFYVGKSEKFHEYLYQ